MRTPIETLSAVYVVIEEYPFQLGFILCKVFDNLLSANSYCIEKIKELDEESKPQFDDWGLCHGINFKVITMDLNK